MELGRRFGLERKFNLFGSMRSGEARRQNDIVSGVWLNNVDFGNAGLVGRPRGAETYFVEIDLLKLQNVLQNVHGTSLTRFVRLSKA